MPGALALARGRRRDRLLGFIAHLGAPEPRYFNPGAPRIERGPPCPVSLDLDHDGLMQVD
jgi:hypothetical protein